MKIGIYGQFYHKEAELINKNKDIDRTYSHFSTFEELDRSYDLFFSIGGDGTILKTVTYVRELGIPIVGINTGRLGFLATIKKEEIEKSVIKILNNQFTISERTLLSVTIDQDNTIFEGLNFAFNEISVSRKNSTTMISVATRLNGEALTKNARPLVISDDTEITLQVSGREDEHLISLDSRIATLENNTLITIKKAPFHVKLLTLEEDSFLKTLREKLLWGEDKRN